MLSPSIPEAAAISLGVRKAVSPKKQTILAGMPMISAARRDIVAIRQQ